MMQPVMHPVQFSVAYPDRPLNRLTTFFRLFMVIPIALIVVVIVAWFAILFTGHYPRELFKFVEGIIRWDNRVLAYAYLLVTDEYPPFRLSP